MGTTAPLEFNSKVVGKVIRRLRKERGLSQEVLSGFAGLARSHLSMIEIGTKSPNFETIWRIAYALNTHPNEIVKMIEDETMKL